MIYLLLNNIDDIKLGSQQVDKIYQGANLIWEAIKSYGGIPCLVDNVYYKAENGLFENTIENGDFFLAFVDIGIAQDITYGYGDKGQSAAAVRVFKLYPTNGVKSTDYWSITSANRTVKMIDRYCIFSISKRFASKFRVIDSAGNYLLKGSEV